LVLIRKDAGNLLFFDYEYKKSVQSALYHMLKSMEKCVVGNDFYVCIAIVNSFRLPIERGLD